MISTITNTILKTSISTLKMSLHLNPIESKTNINMNSLFLTTLARCDLTSQMLGLIENTKMIK